MADLVKYDSLIEGDLFDQDSLNSRFDKIEYAVNDLHEDSTDRGCFNWNHLPSFSYGIKDASGFPGAPSDSFISAFTYATSASSAFEYPSFVVLDSNGSTGSGTELEVIFPDSVFLKSAATAQPQAGGVLVLFDAYVIRIGGNDGSWGQDDHDENCAVFRIEIRQQPGNTWTGLNRTMRFVQQQQLDLGTSGAAVYRKQNINVPIRTLITRDDLTGTNDAVDAIRVGFSIKEQDGDHPVSVVIGHTTLTGLPLHSDASTRLVDGS